MTDFESFKNSSFFKEVLKLKEQSFFSLINIHSALFLQKFTKHKKEEFFLTLLLLSKLEEEGHIYIELKEWNNKEIASKIVCPSLEKWLSILKDEKEIVAIGHYNSTPLVLLETKLYFSRYFNCIETLSLYLESNKDKKTALPSSIQNEIDTIKDTYQKDAILKALTNKVSVISGAPGTGKTYTASKIISFFIKQNPQIKIAAVAPTGKAATKLQESIKKSIPDTLSVSTIHRLLGFGKGDYNFRYNKNNKLNYDLIIVDEVSMVSLSLMIKLIDAVKEKATLVLFGDINQLSSIEPGSVLKYIVDKIPADMFSILKKSYRFKQESGIGKITDLVCNNEKWEDVLNFIRKKEFDDVRLKEFNSVKDLYNYLIETSNINFKDINSQKNLKAIISIFEKFKILSPFKIGKTGTDAINNLIEDNIKLNFKPIMIKKNDYRQSLFNGDTGVYEEDNNSFFFLDVGEKIKKTLPIGNELYEISFATTIHKSQGSEFDFVTIILPNIKQSSFFSKEMIYTAISRAKKEVLIVSLNEV